MTLQGLSGTGRLVLADFLGAEPARLWCRKGDPGDSREPPGWFVLSVPLEINLEKSSLQKTAIRSLVLDVPVKHPSSPKGSGSGTGQLGFGVLLLFVVVRC